MARNELAMYISKQRKVPRHLPDGDRPVEILRRGVIKKEMLREEKREEKLETEVEEAFLPPTIDNMRDCKMCYAVESCMLYRKVSILLFFECWSYMIIIGHRQGTSGPRRPYC